MVAIMPKGDPNGPANLAHISGVVVIIVVGGGGGLLVKGELGMRWEGWGLMLATRHPLHTQHTHRHTHTHTHRPKEAASHEEELMTATTTTITAGSAAASSKGGKPGGPGVKQPGEWVIREARKAVVQVADPEGDDDLPDL